MEFIFFFGFALALLGMYVALRRQIAAPGMTAALGTIASIIMMVLFMLARDSSAFQAIILGVLIGAMFAGATLAIAWYFHSNDLREKYAAEQLQTVPPQTAAQAEEYYDNTP